MVKLNRNQVEINLKLMSDSTRHGQHTPPALSWPAGQSCITSLSMVLSQIYPISSSLLTFINLDSVLNINQIQLMNEYLVLLP